MTWSGCSSQKINFVKNIPSLNTFRPNDLRTPGNQGETSRMYVVSPGSRSWAESQHRIIQLWQENYRTTVLLLFLAEPMRNVLLARNIKWQIVNAFKALVQQHP